MTRSRLYLAGDNNSPDLLESIQVIESLGHEGNYISNITDPEDEEVIVQRVKTAAGVLLRLIEVRGESGSQEIPTGLGMSELISDTLSKAELLCSNLNATQGITQLLDMESLYISYLGSLKSDTISLQTRIKQPELVETDTIYISKILTLYDGGKGLQVNQRRDILFFKGMESFVKRIVSKSSVNGTIKVFMQQYIIDTFPTNILDESSKIEQRSIKENWAAFFAGNTASDNNLDLFLRTMLPILIEIPEIRTYVETYDYEKTTTNEKAESGTLTKPISLPAVEPTVNYFKDEAIQGVMSCIETSWVEPADVLKSYRALPETKQNFVKEALGMVSFNEESIMTAQINFKMLKLGTITQEAILDAFFDVYNQRSSIEIKIPIDVERIKKLFLHSLYDTGFIDFNLYPSNQEEGFGTNNLRRCRIYNTNIFIQSIYKALKKLYKIDDE